MSAEIYSIPTNKLHPFEGHPYKVLDDEDMEALTESIRTVGIMSPLLVRPLKGVPEEYEVISGHRRLHAAIKAGKENVPAFVFNFNRDAAIVLLVDSNLHREHVLPSEKAFAYKMKLEALKHQGIASRQVVGKPESADLISETESGRTVQRYIRLTNLVPPLLDLMDRGRIAFSVGVELSYLSQEIQQYLADRIELDDVTPSLSQAVRMHKESNLTFEKVDEIMDEPKPNQRETIKLRREDFRKYFPANYSDKQIQKDILEGLDLLHRKRQRERDRDSR